MEYWSQVIKSQRARKSLSTLNVFGLSVCVGAALLIMLYVRFELSFDSFHDGDRIYRVESRLYEGATLTDNWATTSFGHAPAMYREIPGIEQYVRVTAQDRGQEVTFGDRQFIEEQYCYTEPAFSISSISRSSRGEGWTVGPSEYDGDYRKCCTSLFCRW